MFMNSLCALMIGFVLDLAVGNPDSRFYPVTLLKKMVRSLEISLRKAYADSPEAQNMAGIMLIVITLVIVVGISLALLVLFYSVSTVTGIIFEGLLCYFSLSIKLLRTSAQGVFRSAKYGNISSARKYLSRITERDTDVTDMDEAMRCTVETVSEGTVNKVVSPIFYMLIFGGMGGVICCAVNTVAEVVGNHTAERIHIGKYPSMLADGVNYIPTRIAAVIMQFSVDYFLLDKERSERIFKRDRDKSLGLNSGYPQSICAGALGIELSGVEYYNGQPVEKPVIGTFTRPLEAYDVYWTNHIMMGTAAYAMMFAALIKIVIFLVFKIVF